MFHGVFRVNKFGYSVRVGLRYLKGWFSKCACLIANNVDLVQLWLKLIGPVRHRLTGIVTREFGSGAKPNRRTSQKTYTSVLDVVVDSNINTGYSELDKETALSVV